MQLYFFHLEVQHIKWILLCYLIYTDMLCNNVQFFTLKKHSFFSVWFYFSSAQKVKLAVQHNSCTYCNII